MSIKNDKWSALSLKDRADLMNMYITNGISDLKEMKKHYNSFSGEENQNDSVYYYDDTYIEPATVKAFDSQEDYNRYYGEQFGKQILKKRDDLLGSYGPLFDPQKIIDNVPAREWGPQKVLGDNDYFVRPGTNMLVAPIQYFADKNTGKQNIEFANQIILDFENMENKQEHIDKDSDYYKTYLDALHYLNHVEGLKKYLGLPYDDSIITESEYKPTRLQNSDEKVYKFSNKKIPQNWDVVVDDMTYNNRKEKQYLDQTLNTFTAYKDRDSKGDFISIYDEWDYNPFIQGGPKILNNIIDVATGGKPFIIYDRVYLDDYYDVPEGFRGNPYITPAILTDTNAFMETE